MDPNQPNEAPVLPALYIRPSLSLNSLKFCVMNNVEPGGPPEPPQVERSIEDPAAICQILHRLTGEPSRPVFRENIEVNRKFCTCNDRRQHGRNCHCRSCEERRSRSPSPHNRRSRSRRRRRSRSRSRTARRRSNERRVDYSR